VRTHAMHYAPPASDRGLLRHGGGATPAPVLVKRCRRSGIPKFVIRWLPTLMPQATSGGEPRLLPPSPRADSRPGGWVFQRAEHEFRTGAWGVGHNRHAEPVMSSAGSTGISPERSDHRVVVQQQFSIRIVPLSVLVMAWGLYRAVSAA
jgi:hypothetical protein